MTLPIGSSLGPFEILAPLGSGGMGEVYKARDTRLGRIVAIKVSKEQFSERFESEARAAAALNHPHLCALYDIGPNYLVMEFIEGPTLADLLRAGPIAIEEAVPLAKQIAEAIEAAHDKNIIHRDLKPANIKVTPEGSAKVLDFGLAKVLEPSGRSSDPANSPTLTMGGTVEGTILGTAAYMAPEQARGKRADRRADVWAFGVVFAEMLTGEQMFKGENTIDILGAVVREQPDLDPVPAAFRPLVARCVTKDPRRRLQSIGEARIVLEDGGVKEAPLAPQQLEPPPPPPSRSWIAWSVAGLAILAAAALALVHFREQTPQPQQLQYTIPIPEKTSLSEFALSPDGRYVALILSDEKGMRLWIRALDSLQAQPLAGTEDAARPFWSPDSRYIGFFAQNKLKKIAVNGGPPQTLCDAPNGRGGTWNADGVIVFSPRGGAGSGLSRVPAAGAVAAPVTQTDGNHRFPVFLPDGKRFLYTETNGKENGIFLASLDSTVKRRLLPDESAAQYLPPGPLGNSNAYVLFVRDGTLMAQPVDPQKLEPAGDLFPIAEQVTAGATPTEFRFTISSQGMLLYRTGPGGGESQLAWFDRGGKEIEKVGSTTSLIELALSPDGKKVVSSRASPSRPGNDLWISDLEHHAEFKLTLDPSLNGFPIWSPDGSKVSFLSVRNGSQGIYLRAANGTGQDEPLLQSKEVKFPYDWSHDGRFIIFEVSGTSTGHFALPVAGDHKPIPLFETAFFGCCSQLSPDDRWLAYVSNDSGQGQVFVQPFAPVATKAVTGKWQISTRGGVLPKWRADGRELFYVEQTGVKLMAVEVKATGNSFNWGTPRHLFDLKFTLPSGRSYYRYAPSPDGQRFLVATDAAATNADQPLTVVVNWLAGIKK